ncbi:hypothetical protein J6590_049043 [Homalodisca vitripennis]|nr:hypothetical protein J6590_049043 [Homalodisca vitripennis]
MDAAHWLQTRPHSYLTRRSILADTFVTYRKREPDLMTRPGKAAHIGPLVWLSLSSTSAPCTTLHTDAPVHSFSALHPSSRGPDDGRGVPIVTHPHVDLLARVNFVSSITGQRGH